MKSQTYLSKYTSSSLQCASGHTYSKMGVSIFLRKVDMLQQYIFRIYKVFLSLVVCAIPGFTVFLVLL